MLLGFFSVFTLFQFDILKIYFFHFRATDIIDLKLLERQDCPAGLSTVAIAKPVPKKAGRTHTSSECSNLNKSNSITNNAHNKSKPIDIETKVINHEVSSNSIKNGTPNKRENNKKDKGKWVKGWKDEACFGSPLDSIIDKEFDFEKNLALFDKQAVYDEINSFSVSQNDQTKKQAKYRYF